MRDLISSVYRDDESLDLLIEGIREANRVGKKRSLLQWLFLPLECAHSYVQRWLPEPQNQYVGDDDDIFYRIDRRKDLVLRQAVNDIRLRVHALCLPKTEITTKINADHVV